ncbi:MAG: dTDP-4-dehydrorhamnose 3,5-epimerase [Sedimentisphaerales bacterium]|nr:dTDP-4-dehydrorhamnose 3,5-epimerase [Sedimentisphaerales bacterium]MBN2841552.1 dTDP-4-dehydrorhamnose 3,5-epimerase [Sedimentisphaerales bacterium]
MNIIKTEIEGVIIFEPRVFKDSRGFFLETFSSGRYIAAGLTRPFVQDNHSFSGKGTVRGLHYQLTQPQGKLVYCITGEIFDVAVDIRQGSPTFGRWTGTILSRENHRQMFIPEGFAHGFCVLSETADVSYKCTDVYKPGDDYGILWNDPEIGIEWPIDMSIALLSDKDMKNPRLSQADKSTLPQG